MQVTEDAPEGFVNGTRVLAETKGALTRDQVMHPKSDWTHLDTWRQKLHEIGIPDADIVDGSEIGANAFCYANNSNVGCRHQGAYTAHVDPSLQGKLTFQLENGQRVRQRGDLVEIELKETSSKQLVGVVVAIYRKADNWGSCRWEELNYKVLAEASSLGPPVGMWIECDELLSEGWVRRRIPRSPPSSPMGSPDRYVHEWIKLPNPH